VTVPLGYAAVYGGSRPDLFVVNNRLSTEPGLYLYQYVGSDAASGAPFFRRRVQCTHPFKAGPGACQMAARHVIDLRHAFRTRVS